VYVHGRSAAGAAPTVTDGIGELAPNGNVRFGDGFGWEYSSEEQYSGARAIIGDIIDDAECSNVVLTGFSNGAAFVAKLYCQGESFEGSVAGFVIDDPVPDTAVQECAPDPSAQVALYWTGGLADDAQPGTECAELGWTCDGDVLLGIEAYAEALGTEILESPYSDHRWFRDAPEINRWLQ